MSGSSLSTCSFFCLRAMPGKRQQSRSSPPRIPSTAWRMCCFVYTSLLYVSLGLFVCGCLSFPQPGSVAMFLGLMQTSTRVPPSSHRAQSHLPTPPPGADKQTSPPEVSPRRGCHRLQPRGQESVAPSPLRHIRNHPPGPGEGLCHTPHKPHSAEVNTVRAEIKTWAAQLHARQAAAAALRNNQGLLDLQSPTMLTPPLALPTTSQLKQLRRQARKSVPPPSTYTV
jgi:hypothetical protein